MFGRAASYRFVDVPSDGRYNLALSQSQLDSAYLYEKWVAPWVYLLNGCFMCFPSFSGWENSCEIVFFLGFDFFFAIGDGIDLMKVSGGISSGCNWGVGAWSREVFVISGAFTFKGTVGDWWGSRQRVCWRCRDVKNYFVEEGFSRKLRFDKEECVVKELHFTKIT